MDEKLELANIDNMPDEVLIEIFQFCSPKLLKLLSLVCGRWNAIAYPAFHWLLAGRLAHPPSLDAVGVGWWNEVISHAPELMKRFRLNASGGHITEVFNLNRKFQNIKIDSLDYYTLEILNQHNIRSLELTDFNVDLEILKKALPKMELLESFSATSITFFNTIEESKKVHLKNLKYLSVRSSNIVIIGIISTTSLKSLSISSSDDVSSNKILLDFLTKQESLQTLKIGGSTPNLLFKSDRYSQFKFKLKFLKINAEASYLEEDLQTFLKHHKSTLVSFKSKNPLEDNTMKLILQTLTTLKSLEISIDFLQNQQPAFFEDIEPLPNIKKLKIHGVFHYKLDNAKLFLDIFPSIEVLNMKNCSPNLGFNSFLVYVSLKYPRLRKLYCFNLHTHVHGQIVSSLTFDDLREFHVAQLLNQNFYSTFIRRHADSLEKISIDRINLANFTPGFFANAIASCKNLREISFTSDTNVVEKMFRKVHMRCPRNSDNFFESWRSELKPKTEYRLSFKFPDDIGTWQATWYTWNDEIDKASGSFDAE